MDRPICTNLRDGVRPRTVSSIRLQRGRDRINLQRGRAPHGHQSDPAWWAALQHLVGQTPHGIGTPLSVEHEDHGRGPGISKSVNAFSRIAEIDGP